MGGFTYSPKRWNAAAAAAWAVGERDKAIQTCIAALEAEPSPDADAFVQPGYYLFLVNRFAESAALLARAAERFPDHPMILLSLGGSATRAHKSADAIAAIERFLALGYSDATAFDALAHSYAQVGDRVKAQLFGTMALTKKDKATKERWGKPRLRPVKNVDKRPSVIAFTLWGSDPRYLRGALQNALAARELYPGWTCRFYVDDSVDAALLETLSDEGADVRMDDGEQDIRHRLCRRFLVADDKSVGRFIVRDCDSVVSAREAAAVAEWIESGLPFHVMRDWYTHTDPMLAGMWGGFAGAFPNLERTLNAFREEAPPFENWDQWFLRERVWPAIRDRAMIHDRCFGSHRAQPFPTPTPPGREHVGQNEFVSDAAGQAAALSAFAARVPALKIAAEPVRLTFRTNLND